MSFFYGQLDNLYYATFGGDVYWLFCMMWHVLCVGYLWLFFLFHSLLKNGSMYLERGEIMRHRTIPKVDKEVFRRTASHTKAINLGMIRFRGGTRL